MGNWNISIQGVGCHHNNNSKIDADFAAHRFIEELKAQGQLIQSATFTFGGSEDLKHQPPLPGQGGQQPP